MKRFSTIAITLVILVGFLGLTFDADAAVRVRGYYRKDGTYVQPHYRSNPDGNPYNNWSFPGNVNPYTGKVAPGNPDTYLNNYYNKSDSSYTVPSAPDYSAPSYIPPVDPSDTYQSVTGGYKSYGILFCSNGYYKQNDSCKKAPENGYALYTDFSCDSGYYKSGDMCKKAPDSGYALDTDFLCNSGFEKSGDQCVRKSIPNAYWNGTGYSCNVGYLVNQDKNACIPIDAVCKEQFGAFAKAYGDSQCICNEGYEWNIGKTLCIQKVVVLAPPIPPKYTFSRTLKLNMTGEDVKQLQLILNRLGYLQVPPGTVLGYFGELTMQALTKYQTSIGLPPVGVFGPMTREKINSQN